MKKILKIAAGCIGLSLTVALTAILVFSVLNLGLLILLGMTVIEAIMFAVWINIPDKKKYQTVK